jgi:dTDP-4-dehydrorhamnose reductase
MIVAVLGANGQLGSDILRVISADPRRDQVLPLSRKDLDISNLEAIPAVLSKLRFEVLVNCTGYHKTDEVETHATEAMRINAHAVSAMAKSCKSQRARFVHISTDYVFDGNERQPYTETDSPRPINVYGTSKLLGESLALRGYPEATLVMRVASLFGVVGSSGKGGNFIETILRRGKETGEVRVVNDITMSPSCAAIVAGAILDALRQDAPPGIYHVVNSGSATWFEFAKQIVEEAGVPAEVIPVTSDEYPSVAIRPSYSVLNNHKISRIVGELPHWKDALRLYLMEKRVQLTAQSASGAG